MPWVELEDGREWWVPEGVGRLDAPPLAMPLDEYLDDVRDWSSLAAAASYWPEDDYDES